MRNENMSDIEDEFLDFLDENDFFYYFNEDGSFECGFMEKSEEDWIDGRNEYDEDDEEEDYLY